MLRDSSLDPLRIAEDARFWKFVHPEANTGCWLWGGVVNLLGYGRFRKSRSNTMLMAHRHSYLLAGGIIADGQIVMHSCDNPTCVNPSHLRAGTYKENTADCAAKGRRAAAPRTNLLKTHCPSGHPYSGDNLINKVQNGGPARACRTCMRKHWRENQRKKRLALLDAHPELEESK